MTKAEQLRQLYAELAADLPNLPLGNIGERLVPGDGDPESPVMFIGEAPGYNESVEGKPFVGRSGKYFTNVSAEVGWPRPKIYISNIIKIRPPDNRDPTADEILAYKPYLDQEIEIIHPRLIVTLGRYSMGKFLPDVKISQVHGRLHKVQWEDKTVFILPCYHPAAVLRNPGLQQSFKDDFVKIPKILDWIAKGGKNEVEEAVKSALL